MTSFGGETRHKIDSGRGLIEEISRYLAIVDVFRAEGADLSWASEPMAGWGEGEAASGRAAVSRNKEVGTQ